MKVLVTGASGYIGGELVKQFASEGFEVLAVYHLRQPHWDDMPHSSIQNIRADLAVQTIDVGPLDLVVHAAAHTPSSKGSTVDDFMRGNVETALSIAKTITHAKPALLVYLSTVSVYGRVKEPVLTENTSFDRPCTYGLTKYLSELILNEKLNTIPWVCLRLPGVVGPNCFSPWLGKILAHIKKNRTVRIYNPNAPFNNIVDTAEIYRLIKHLISTRWQDHTTVNMAASYPISIKEVIALLIKTIGSSSQVINETRDKVSFKIDTRRLETQLGFSPRRTAEMVSAYGRINR
jgi:UDP-glucose 4-epimerase